MSTTPLSSTAAAPRLQIQADFGKLQTDAAVWFDAHWQQLAVGLVAAAAIYLLLNLLRSWSTKLCRREDRTTWYAVIGRALARTSQLFIILASARLVIGFADTPQPVDTAIGTLFTIAAVFQAAVWLREMVFGAIELRALGDVHQGQALVSALGIIRLLVTIAIFAIASIVILGNLGVNVAGLIAGLGIGGIAIGLAAQGIFADLFAALAILFDRPFRVGDVISYAAGKSTGTVEAIGLKSTRVRATTGEQRIIANKKLLDGEILNLSRRLHNRFKYEFLLDFATGPEAVLKVPELLKRAVESEGHRLIHGGLQGFADTGLKYFVEFQSVAADFPPDARDRVAAAILDEFHRHGLRFAGASPLLVVAETSVSEDSAAQRHER
jgi:small-conductance mechanosensitive channel